MSITHEFDSKCGVLRIQLKNRFDIVEYSETLAQITSGKDYHAATPTIWDLRAFDFVEFDTRLAHNVKILFSLFKSRKNANIAFVVSTDLGYGMMRMLQNSLNIKENSLVCYNYDDAEEWIKTVYRQKHQ